MEFYIFLEKSGEGSRGGLIIGHTSSGKPIYNEHGHASHKKFSSQDHKEAAKRHDIVHDQNELAWKIGQPSLIHKDDRNVNHKDAAAAHRKLAKQK